MSRYNSKNERKLYKCGWRGCGKGFEVLSQLVTHLSEIHVGFKKEEYCCDWEDCARAGKVQASRFSLISHLRSHTGEKPYPCTFPSCNRDFTRSDSLAKHIKTHHPGFEEIQQSNMKKAEMSRAAPSVYNQENRVMQQTIHHSSSLSQTTMNRINIPNYPPPPSQQQNMMLNNGRMQQMRRGNMPMNYGHPVQGHPNYGQHPQRPNYHSRAIDPQYSQQSMRPVPKPIIKEDNLTDKQQYLIAKECLSFIQDEISDLKEKQLEQKDKIRLTKLENTIICERIRKTIEKKKRRKEKLKAKKLKAKGNGNKKKTKPKKKKKGVATN